MKRSRLVLWLACTGLVAAAAVASVQVFPGCADPALFPDASGPKGDGFIVKGDTLLAGLKSLRIVPLDAEIAILDNKPATQTFQAFGKFVDGSEREITLQTEFFADNPAVGVFTGPLFTSGAERGGKTVVTATAAGVSATTTLTVTYKRRFLGAGVPADIEAKLAKATEDGGRAPSLAYPPDAVMIPPNLNEMEIQWLPGAGNDLYEVALRNSGTDIRFYTKCTTVGAGCGLIPDETAWKALVTTLKGADPVKITVRGSDSASTSSAGTSQARELRVAEEEIQGGLYYWNTSGLGAIVRFDFGKPGQKQGKTFYTAADAKALFCVGCHVMSRDGKQMAVGLDMPAPSPLKVVDVATRDVISSGAANFMTFSPDNSMIITSDGNSMVLRDTKTLAAIKPDPLAAKGTMPDWSADGTRVVFAEPKVTFPLFGAPGISNGSIKILAYDKTAKTWSGALTLAATNNDNNYYPTFSPDGQWVVFNRCGQCKPAQATGGSSGDGSSYDARDATLYIVRADGKGKPMEMKLANGGVDLCNSWPKFSPFMQKYKAGKLMWVTFSSRRDYGLRLSGTDRAQIWMAAIDPAKAELTDPSHAAFWLPFQDIKTGNHIAQWAETVARKPCVEDKECPGGEFCDKGLCEPKGIE